MDAGPVQSPSDYRSVMESYLTNQSESALYRASLLSQVCIENGLGPEDIVALHFEILDSILAKLSYREHARIIGEAHQFLLEVMIAYGVKYKEYLEFQLEASLRDAEARAVREHERALEAERIQREKTEILGVIAHEIRTPLTVARGNIDLVQRSIARGVLDPVEKMLSTAGEALNRLSRLSADLVEASRGEAPPMRMTPVNLVSVAESACRWVLAAAESKGVAVEHAFGQPEIIVRGNQDGLLSVLGNLLSNAVRYTPPGGSVVVRLWANLTSEPHRAVVEVADTGIGMSPEVQARIFEKFYRGPEAREVEPRGLGLGLALVRDIVVAHGGEIHFTSTDGQGSVFAVYIPLDEQGSHEATG